MLQRLILILAFLALSTACNTTTSRMKPVVDIVSPPDGAQYAPGESVDMRIAATSANTIARIEVHSGTTLVASQDNPTPSVTLTSLVQFVPTQAGNVSLVVTAIDASGQRSDPVALTIRVVSTSSTGSPATGNGSTSPDGAPTVSASACKPNAVFVSDVTIPDNTVVSAGSKLVKTWRLRNNGTCAWDAGYILAFLDGEQMGAPESVSVAPTARDAVVDISVPFTAPGSSGTYTSTWRMRSPDGGQFGNRVYVLIRVP